MSQDTVRHLEKNIRRAKEIVEISKALDRLTDNRDFKLVITKGYLVDESVRLVHLKADPAMQTPERQANLVAQIDAIGGLLSYFRAVTFNAIQAVKAIESDEATIAEIAAEELEQ